MRSIDGFWGSKTRDGEWVGMVGMIQRKVYIHAHYARTLACHFPCQGLFYFSHPMFLDDGCLD